MVVLKSGNIGIGTNSPVSKLEINGETRTDSLRIGENGSLIKTLQKGTATIGPNASAFKTYTLTFPIAFSSIPSVTATLRNDPSWDVNDTYVATIRSISTTSVVFNILRVDLAGGWSQNLLLEWRAIQ